MTPAQKRKQAHLDTITSFGWSGPDRFGHYKMDVEHDGRTIHCRLKIGTTGWRVERQYTVPATQWSKEEKRWTAMRTGYFSKTVPARDFRKPFSPLPR